MKTFLHLLALGVLGACFSGPLSWACNVPVFRYALERWPADMYEVVVLHDGELSSADKDRLETMQQSRRESAPANFVARAVQISDVNDDLLHELWNNRTHTDRHVRR